MRPSKRAIEKKVDDLHRGDNDDGPPLVFNITYFEHEGRWPKMDDSPHPELTIKPFPEQKPQSLKIATPNVIPEPWCNQTTLFVHTCENADTYLLKDDDGVREGSVAVPACRLWDALDDDDRRREREIEANGEPLPPFLEHETE